jgi:hypothetical protein
MAFHAREHGTTRGTVYALFQGTAIEDAGGHVLRAPWTPPPGGRRAGLLGHSYRPKLIGLRTRQFTGWLTAGDDGVLRHAPHTETGYVAPPNKTLLLLLNGALAKRGVRAAAPAAR